MLRLLCFTAHPDDEAGGFGGTLLHYAGRGMETHVVCLTSGTAASHRGGARSDQELAQMRREEFARACKLLRVGHGTVLDYPDAKLDQQSFYGVVADLTRRVREIRPHVVLTMGTEGALTAHPDHSMVSLFSTMAFHWAGRANRFPEQLQNGLGTHRPQKLYYSTAMFTMPDRPPVALAPATTVIDLTKEAVQTKIAAFQCHTSQAPLFPYFSDHVARRSSQEMFHLASAVTPRKAELETDLFTGVEE